MAKKRSFWTTLPGILTGIAAVITAASGLYLVLAPGHHDQIPPNESIRTESTQREDAGVSACDEEVKSAWELVQAHRGQLTDAIDDIITFQEVVLDIGCLRHPYTIDLGGKQNIGRFTITVMSQWPHSPSPNKTYVYKEFVTSIEVGGQFRNVHSNARRIKGSSGDWELLD